MTFTPRPGTAPSSVAVPAPGPGPQQWSGAPSAVLDHDGSVVLAYRRRDDRGDANVIARSADGEGFTTVAVLDRDRWGAAMVERPALVRLGDPVTAVKDPVICFDGHRWQAWLCCHHLDLPGAEDRMSAAYATSADGLTWSWHGTVLTGRPGTWDARGARVTAVLPDGRACYDGRATAEENWFERCGLAEPVGNGPGLVARDAGPIADVRYLDVLPLPDGRNRIFYEARRRDGSHELRTELLPGVPA